MTSVPLGVSAYDRSFGQEPNVRLVNRFLEQTPTNQVERSVLLSRPGTDFLVGAGNTFPRDLFSRPGVFNETLFFVSGDTVYLWDGENAPVALSGTVNENTSVSIAAVAGTGYTNVFFADGESLQYYDGVSAASATLTVTTVSAPDIVTTDTVSIGPTYYQWTDGDVDAGTPDGTMANPFLVALGTDDNGSLENLRLALNDTGIAGTEYSTIVERNTQVEGVQAQNLMLDIRARERGVDGNAIALTETGANIAWDNPTMEGGGEQRLNGVVTPDGVGIVSVGALAGFILCVVANSDRVYYIRPAALTIDALDFFTAETEPDQLIQVLTVNDHAWLFGQSSTEVWYPNPADVVRPRFLRTQGRALSQGSIEGTAVRIRNRPIVVAEDGKVYDLSGSPQRISTNFIEEKIRIALARRRNSNG